MDQKRTWVDVSFNEKEREAFDQEMQKRGFTKRAIFIKWALLKFLENSLQGHL